MEKLTERQVKINQLIKLLEELPPPEVIEAMIAADREYEIENEIMKDRTQAGDV